MIQPSHATQQQLSANPAFKDLKEKFLEKGWLIKTDIQNKLEFKSPTSDYDIFEFLVESTEIHVTVPLKNSKYQYFTKFSDYFSACEFVEMHLLELKNE
jgi:hypothetical protein